MTFSVLLGFNLLMQGALISKFYKEYNNKLLIITRIELGLSVILLKLTVCNGKTFLMRRTQLSATLRGTSSEIWRIPISEVR
jgi:hypothetical protein